ncbi:MAG: hypothetical protein SNJ59_07465 [Aggregatilineales bacterium]
MADQRQRRLMQEALDDELTPEMLQMLRQRLAAEPEEAEQFQQLKQVDRLLRMAPFERAPETLAVKIMARLAEGLQPYMSARTSGLALALGLALVTLALMPLLAGLGWLILNMLGSPAALGALIGQLAGLLAAVFNGLSALAVSAEALLAAFPELPFVLILTIPIAIFWLLRLAAQNHREEL